MALVNQQAVAAGNSTVGFINPLIYQIGEGSSYPTDFQDVPQGAGNNDCCGQPVWFNTEDGYDLVTGWGSPNGQGLIDALAGGSGGPPPPPPPSTDYTLASNEWCTQTTANLSCLTSLVVPGAYSTWSWPQDTGGYQGDAPVPPAGTQAILAIACDNNIPWGAIVNSPVETCTSPTLTFPNVPVSSTAQVTVYMSGEESSAMVTENHFAGVWINLTTTTGTKTPSVLGAYLTGCGSSSAGLYDCMGAGDEQGGQAGWGWGPPCYGVDQGGCGAWDVYPELVGNFDPLLGPTLDTSVIFGITNLNQIQVSVSAVYGNAYDGFIWASVN